MTVEMIAYLLMILLIVYLGIQLIDKEDMLRNMKVKYQELLGRNSDLEWKYRELESSPVPHPIECSFYVISVRAPGSVTIADIH